MRGRTGIVLALILICGAAHATRYPLTVKDCRGKRIVIEREPRRIVSITPSNTEILCALGLESRIVGVTRYCDYPKTVARKTKVGDRTTSVEKVVSLKPDLVFGHGYVNDDAIRSLEKHGIKCFAVDPKTIRQVEQDILLIGKITNREKAAARVAGRISDARALVKQRSASLKSRPKVLVAVQADPLWVAGPKTFVDEMIALAGGTNVAADAKPGFTQFSAEAAVYRDPDIIIGTSKGDKQVFMRGVWKETRAARSGRVYEADPDLLVRPGPRLADGILGIAKMVNPHAFDKR